MSSFTRKLNVLGFNHMNNMKLVFLELMAKAMKLKKFKVVYAIGNSQHLHEYLIKNIYS